MHYYKRHLGDFARDTAHLSQGQVGAFDLLLDWYYSNERPLPTDKADLYRIGRAHSASERANVDKALSFFMLGEDGYRQKRADAELAQSAAQAATNRRIAAERESRKRSRQQHEPLNDSLNELANFVVPSHKPVTIKEQELEASNLPSGKLEVSASADADPLAVDEPADAKAERCPLAAIVELYHAALPQLPRVEKLTQQRQGYIRQRWREDLPTLEAWERYFGDVAASDFLMGRAQGRNGSPPFRADLEWLTRPGNFAKVAEAKYHRRNAA